MNLSFWAQYFEVQPVHRDAIASALLMVDMLILSRAMP
jgi:hypothetical protein